MHIHNLGIVLTATGAVSSRVPQPISQETPWNQRLVHRSLAADIAVGVVGAAVVIAVVLLYFGLLMRPNNHVEAIAKLLVLP